ncbi:MAG: diguanylate cyclase [Candidatus Aminicenantes bacterium]|nr:diguanylate cyclase [Candidatus Aminicenantes bacterium]
MVKKEAGRIPPFRRIKNFFLHLKIANKILLGSFPLFILIVVTGVFALVNIERLSGINANIVLSDIPLLNIADALTENLYSMELHANRFVILRNPEIKKLFEETTEEFTKRLQGIGSISGENGKIVEKLAVFHKEYTDIFKDWFTSLENSGTEQKDYNRILLEKQKGLLSSIEDMKSRIITAQKEKIETASHIGFKAFRTVAVLGFLSIFVGVVSAWIITRHISGTISRLKDATGAISKGKFDLVPEVRSQDELGELVQSFADMAVRLKRLEEMYLDANPLTHLPGGVAIDNILKKRIEAGQKIAFCLIDLDNFKVFNDRYGYARGNMVIINTARVIENAVARFGSKECFFGHIGGDDFVLMASIDRYDKICRFVVGEFDKMVVKEYSSEDRKKGYVYQKSRQGKLMKYPIMTLSIGVVTNEKIPFEHIVQVGERAAEMKNYAKSRKGSFFAVDRRKD